MQPKRTICLLVSFGLALVANAQAPDTSTNKPAGTNQLPALMDATESRKTRVLSLEECIKLALEHNLDIQIQEFNPIINQYLVGVNLGAYEPVFNFTGTKNYSDSAGNIDSQTGKEVGGHIVENDTYSPEVKGILPTGLTYDVTGRLDRNSIYNQPVVGPGGYLPPFYTSDVNLTLSQPLLKNFWIDNTRLQIQLSKDTLKISQAALQLQVMGTVTSVKNAYFNLLYARDNVEANATAYKLAQQLVTENLKRVEVGALAPLDEKQSESQAAASLAAMHAAEQTLILDENILKNLLMDNYPDWAGVTILPAEELAAVPETLDLQESWRRAVAQRPDLVEAKLKVEAQNVTLKYDLNQIFPELDVVGSYGRNASRNTALDNFDELRTGNHSSYSYGAFVSIPLGGNYAARNQYKAGKATLKQLLLQLKQIEQTIIVAVDNDVGQLRAALQQVYATRDARFYAQEALDAERKKLENGKSTSFIVLQLISNLTSARVAEIQALANYNIAIAQLKLDEGSTLEANHIQLKLK